jgi:threonine aldolase
MIDLRSDTVTRPTDAMREAMARAEVGDDVFSEDPTTRALEEEVARLLGKDAALFVSSGTMGNQLAIALHTRPGDEVIVGEGAHPVWYESGAAAVLSGVQFATAGQGGLFDAEQMEEQIKPDAYYYPRTSLVCVENTHNRAGGKIWPQAQVVALGERVKARGLAFHLDGARLWNASVASGRDVRDLARPFDTVTVCLSKGLGAPAGSVLTGTQEQMVRARRLRKMWGGGMRQTGILAAAGLFALAHHRKRLSDDHEHARRFAQRVTDSGKATAAVPETNIVNVDVPAVAEDVVRQLRDENVLVNATGARRLRIVFHLDVAADQVDKAADALIKVLGHGAPPKA